VVWEDGGGNLASYPILLGSVPIRPHPMNIRMPPDVQSVEIGEQTVLFIDDFLEDPQALVQAACASRFEPCDPRGERKGYPGIRADAPAAYNQAVAQLVEPLVKINYGVPEALPLLMALSAFSITTTPEAELGPLQRIPHFDNSTPYGVAAVLYLCQAPHGGTGFYRHRASGWQHITAERREHYLDLCHEELNRRPPPARYIGPSDAHFEFLGMLPARFNRLAVYPGSVLHSACIDPAHSLDPDPRRGRLTMTSFFDF